MNHQWRLGHPGQLHYECGDGGVGVGRPRKPGTQHRGQQNKPDKGHCFSYEATTVHSCQASPRRSVDQRTPRSLRPLLRYA
jgi:hypothetical protein